MTTSKVPATICLPAHILDADISPRAREVLMLLASQTTAENPMVWVCSAATAERLRCSPVTVKRAIQRLIEAKLIVETGDFHERRYKFYRVKWSLNDKLESKTRKKSTVTPRVQKTEGQDWIPASDGMTEKESRPAPQRAPKPTEHVPPHHPGVDHAAMLKDDRIAYWAEVARQKHEENLKRYRMEKLMLEQDELRSREFGNETHDERGSDFIGEPIKY